MIIKVRTPVYYASLYIEIANSFSAALRLFNKFYIQNLTISIRKGLPLTTIIVTLGHPQVWGSLWFHNQSVLTY